MKKGRFTTKNQPATRGPGGNRSPILAARARIREAQIIGWKALEESWSKTLALLEAAKK